MLPIHRAGGATAARGDATPSRPRAPALPAAAASSSTDQRFDLPDLGYGVGLRGAHYDHILEHEPDVDWFEILSENYLATGGRRRQVLDRIARKLFGRA